MVKIKEAQAEAATALSGVGFKIGDLGDTMKTVEEILQKRYEVSAGKARVAKDMVNMEQIEEKENERKALEQNALAEFLASQGIQTPAAASDAPVEREGDWPQMAEARFTAVGKLVSIVLIAGLIALGVYMVGFRPGGGGRRPFRGGAGATTRLRPLKSPKCRSTSRSCRHPRRFS